MNDEIRNIVKETIKAIGPDMAIQRDILKAQQDMSGEMGEIKGHVSELHGDVREIKSSLKNGADKMDGTTKDISDIKENCKTTHKVEAAKRKTWTKIVGISWVIWTFIIWFLVEMKDKIKHLFE